MPATVAITYAYRSARNGELVEITDEAGARAVVDRFGHALKVTAVVDDDGRALHVTTPATRGEAGAFRLHAMAVDAGLLAHLL